MIKQTEKPNILVSVIMGVYNQWDYTALNQAVDSILNQTLKELEFIIYDDGSAPEASGYIWELQRKDPRIRICGARKNHGLAFSLNACIGLARGRYIARMDADDMSAPERLQRQYEFLESHPEYSWCGTNARLFDADSVWGYRQMPERPSEKDYLKFSPYIHPTVMYRREVLVKNPYADSAETLRCEDYEIFMRLRQRGYCGYNLQEPLFYYREDRESFLKRTMHARINEAKIRFRNFKKMGLLFPTGWVYVIRPVAAGLLPGRLIAWLKRRESGVGASTTDKQNSRVPAAAEKKSGTVSSVD